MATVTPENLTVKFNLKGSVILDIDTYNSLRLRSDIYDEMLFESLNNVVIVDKEPSTWSPSIIATEGCFHIPNGIFNAVVTHLVNEILQNKEWLKSLHEGGEIWLDLVEGRFKSYEPSTPYKYNLLTNSKFADAYFAIGADPDGTDNE